MVGNVFAASFRTRPVGAAVSAMQERCSGLSIGYTLALALFGGTAPLVAPNQSTGLHARRFSDMSHSQHRWTIVVIYAMAMALVEAAVVAYLRALFNVADPYQPNSAAVPVWAIQTEIAREAATMVMLAMVGWLAGQTRRSRFGYFLIAFGVWDIFYYIFLVPLTGWPRSVMDWDILFLIPLPWWGPVLAPVLIAALMVAAGTLISQFDREEGPLWPGRWSWGVSLAGALVVLYVFMADAIRVAGEGYEAIQNVRPTWFNWPLFIVALGLLAAPITDMWWQGWGRAKE